MTHADSQPGFDPSARQPQGARAWLGAGVWTVLDQGLFAGANFVVNVLLARWLPEEAFGAFMVAYTLFLLAGTVHGGVLIEPMLVFGPGRFADRLERYLGVVLRGHLLFAGVAGLGLALGALACWIAGEGVLAASLGALSLAQVFILFQWTLRHACYIETRPRVAAWGGMLYAALMLGGAGLLYATGGLQPVTAIALMGIASAAAGGLIAYQLKLRLTGLVRRVPREDLRLTAEAGRVHRGYGRWAAATGALEWVQGYLPLVALPLVVGLAASGALRALINFALPMMHVFQAMGVLLVPVFVRALRDGSARRVGALALTGALALAVGYGVPLALLGEPLVGLLYDGKYVEYAHLLVLVGGLGLLWGIASVLIALLRAAERPRAVFAARVTAASATVLAGLALLGGLGVAGALWAEIAGMAAEVVAIVWMLRRGVVAAPRRPPPVSMRSERPARAELEAV